jgi:tetratricopeptide (TPR) repeat protein
LAIDAINSGDDLWGTIKQNLAMCLKTIGLRSEAGIDLNYLAQAVVCYRDALTVFKKAKNYDQWVTVTQNLAVTLKTQGERTDGSLGVELIAEAVKSYQKILEELTDEIGRLHITQNLAVALHYQRARTVGQKGIALLNQSIATFEATLQKFEKVKNPVFWAKIQENMAFAFVDLARHPSASEPKQYLERAKQHSEAALTIYDIEHLSRYHANTTFLRDDILAQIAALPK